MLHVIRRLYVGYAVAGLAMLWPDVKRLAFDWLPDMPPRRCIVALKVN